MMNSFNLTLSEKHFICPPILNESFAGQSSLGGRSLPFKTWNISFQPLLACCISSLKDDFMTWLTQACVLQCRGTAKTLLVTSSQIAQMLSCWLLTLSQFVSNKGNRHNDTCSPIHLHLAWVPLLMSMGCGQKKFMPFPSLATKVHFSIHCLALVFHCSPQVTLKPQDGGIARCEEPESLRHPLGLRLLRSCPTRNVSAMNIVWVRNKLFFFMWIHWY